MFGGLGGSFDMLFTRRTDTVIGDYCRVFFGLEYMGPVGPLGTLRNFGNIASICTRPALVESPARLCTQTCGDRPIVAAVSCALA